MIGHFVWQSDWLEVFSFVTAVVGIYFLAIEVIWGWPIAIASSGAYAFFFFQGKLYADMSLNLFYCGILIHGWWSWRRNPNLGIGLLVSRLSRTGWVWVTVALGVGMAAYLPIIQYFKGASPLADSSLAVASYVSQYLQNRKFIENWWCWIIVNAGYLALYFSRNYYLTSVLSLVLIVLSVVGHKHWSQSLRDQHLPTES